MAIPETVLEELRSKHKRIEAITCEAGDVVVRAPTRGEYKAWRARKEQPEALEDLVRQCVVYCNGVFGAWPDVVARFDEMLDVYPAFADSKAVGGPLMRFLGLTAGDAGKG